MINWLCTEFTIFRQIPKQYHEELHILLWLFQEVMRRTAENDAVVREMRKLPKSNDVAIYILASPDKKEWVKNLCLLRDPNYRILFDELGRAKNQLREDKVLLHHELEFKKHHPDFILGFLVGTEKESCHRITEADQRILARHDQAVQGTRQKQA